MGMGFGATCKKCGYSYCACLGIGFSFPRIYKETVEKMKSGGYGEFAKNFFKEYPGAAVDCENIVVKCATCGCFDTDKRLTLYKPKAEAAASNDSDYVLSIDFARSYEKAADLPHYCSKCGKETEIVENYSSKLQKGQLKCPKCRGAFIEDGSVVMWD